MSNKPCPQLQPLQHSSYPKSCRIRAKAPPAVQLLSEQVWQDETWRFGLHAVDPEVGTAGVVLVPPIRQLEVISLRIEGLQEEWKQV